MNKADVGAQSVEEWSRMSGSVNTAIAEFREAAERGHEDAKAFVRIVDAMKAKQNAERWDEPTPAWVRETLSFLDEYQINKDDQDAISALTAAIQ